MEPKIKYSEQELVGLLKEQNNDAFNYLYDHYSGALYTIINQIVPDKDTASDVLQEVFVNIWRKMNTYDETKGRLFTWMLNIGRNAAIDKVRSKGYRDNQRTQPIAEGENTGMAKGGQDLAALCLTSTLGLFVIFPSNERYETDLRCSARA